MTVFKGLLLMSDSCKDISSLLKKTGFENLDKKFFEPALTHPSYTIEHKLPPNDFFPGRKG